MQVYWKTNARKMYIIMQMSILGQNFIQIQSDKEHTHTHTRLYSIIKKPLPSSPRQNQFLFGKLFFDPQHTQPPSLPSFDLWSNVEFLVLKPSSRHFSFFLFLSPFPFYRPSSDGILMILIIAFLIHHFNFFLAEKKRVSSGSKKWQIDEWRCIKF